MNRLSSFFSTMLITLLLIMVNSSAQVSHPASEITSGIFAGGDYTFPSGLSVKDGFIAVTPNSVGTADPRTSDVGADNILVGVGSTSDYIISVQDGTGRVQHYWNAEPGKSPTFLVGGEDAGKMLFTPSGNNWFTLSWAEGGSANAGDPITWTEHFKVQQDGDVDIAAGNLLVSSGDVIVSSGDATITSGDVIVSNGGVGIGTTPNTKLDILSDSGDAFHIINEDTESDIYMGGTDEVPYVSYIRTDGDGLRISTSDIDSNDLYISSEGNVGIGTRFVNSEKLTIDTRGTLNLRTLNLISNPTTLNVMSFSTGVFTDSDKWDLVSWGTVSDSDDMFSIRNANEMNVLNILQTGEVGIGNFGTSGPQSLLHVSAGTVGDAEIIIETDTDDGGSELDNPSIHLLQDGGGIQGLIALMGINNQYGINGARNNALVLQAKHTLSNNYGHLQLATNDQVRMTVEPKGNIGIGTYNPSALFEVDASGKDNKYGTHIIGGRSNVLMVENDPDLIYETPVPFGARTNFIIYNNNHYFKTKGTSDGDANLVLINERGDWTLQAQSEGDFRINNNVMPILTRTRFMISNQPGTQGYVGIGTETITDELTVDGDIRASGNICSDIWGCVGGRLSSQRYKENIQPLNDDYYRLLELEPKTFNFIETGKDGIGYIAEDLDALGLENTVVYNQEGVVEGINYDAVLVYALEIIKNQQNEIEDLKAIICSEYPKEDLCK